jgi:hypothetical protein
MFREMSTAMPRPIPHQPFWTSVEVSLTADRPSGPFTATASIFEPVSSAKGPNIWYGLRYQSWTIVPSVSTEALSKGTVVIAEYVPSCVPTQPGSSAIMAKREGNSRDTFFIIHSSWGG